MESKVGVRKWWGEEGYTEKKARDMMMDLDASHITDPKIKDFIEIAYPRSFRHYGQRQKEGDIWGSVMKEIRVGNLREQTMKSRANRAPGPSGVSIEMMKLMSDDNLERFAETMNGIMTEGEQVPESWNMTLLRSLPKTEVGMYAISKTRPIALMEVILKLLERVVFSRINYVIDDNDMPRGEQYGGINGRQIQEPIRILAELIEDANVTKKS